MEYFKNKRFFKVLNAANYKNGYEYDDGLNDVSQFIGVDGEPFECFFTDIEHIFCYIYYGPCYREIFIPDNVPIINYKPESFSINEPLIPGFSSNKVILGDLKLWNVSNIKKLIEEGADISVCDYHIVRWALVYNFEIFYFLQNYIIDLDENLWLKILQNLQLEGFL